MNVFATLKTVFFGSKVLSRPVSADGTPRRDLAIALNGLLPLCRAIPGMHLAVDIREGRAALVLDWTPRTDEKALSGAYHYESLPVRMGQRQHHGGCPRFAGNTGLLCDDIHESQGLSACNAIIKSRPSDRCGRIA